MSTRLPQFDDDGNLPTGIHLCEIDEVVERFGSGSPEREVETAELREFVEWCRLAGVVRLLVNGSYTTSKNAPNDVDIVILPGLDYPRDQESIGESEVRFPFLQIIVAADNDDFESWAHEDFGTDRQARPKGVVEVQL